MELEDLISRLKILGLVEHTEYFGNDVYFTLPELDGDKKYFTLPELLWDRFSFVCKISTYPSGHVYMEMWKFMRNGKRCGVKPWTHVIDKRIDFLSPKDEEEMAATVEGVKKLLRQIRKDLVDEL